MQPTPEDWPRIAPAIFYDRAGEAIDWLCAAFGFELRLRIDGDGGRVEHSELELDDGLVMVATSDPKMPGTWKSPVALDGVNTQSLCVYVDDVDAHCARAREAGATISQEPKTDDYGEEHGSHRTYRAVDPEGHHWWFMTRVRAPKPSAR